MEKIDCICTMRELVCAVNKLEESLSEIYDMTLNEAMVLCAIGDETVNAGEIAARTGLKSPNVSKVLGSVEGKGLVMRAFGKTDRRQVCFSLTDKAKQTMQKLKADGIPVPEYLGGFFPTVPVSRVK